MVTYIIFTEPSSLPECLIGRCGGAMSRTSRLAAVFRGENRATARLAVLPTFSIAILFVSSVPITALTVAIPAITFPVAVTIAVSSLSIALRVSLALSTVLSVAFAVSVTIPAALAITFRAVTAVLTSLRGVRVLATAFALETPIVRTVHLSAVYESFAARPALCARVPGSRPCRWRL
jgi:hypothetical protein